MTSLSPVRGATDDPFPGECQRFRGKWSRLFIGVDEGEPDDAELLDLRYHVRGALLQGGPESLRELAIRMANRPARTRQPGQAYPPFKWFEFTLRDGSTRKAPILFDFPRALAAALLSFSEKGRKLVCCRQWGRCVRGRSNQRFCPGGKCRLAWHRSQPAYKEKWRKYMKQKMREYRALEKLRNQTNQKLSRRKHAKAT